MFCSKCNYKIPDDSEFCQYCGNKITPVDVVIDKEKRNKKDKKTDKALKKHSHLAEKNKIKKASLTIRIISSALIIFIGVILVIQGFMFSESTFSYLQHFVSFKQYSYSIYTEMQNDIATAANAIRDIGEALEQFIQRAYIEIGIVVVLIGVYLLWLALRDVYKNETSETNTLNGTVPGANSNEDPLVKIEKAKSLFDSGALTQEEFNEIKKHLLGGYF